MSFTVYAILPTEPEIELISIKMNLSPLLSSNTFICSITRTSSSRDDRKARTLDKTHTLLSYIEEVRM
jgi:hypothetical protein